MANEILNILIKFLGINCSMVNCYQYPSDLHALFFVIFLPMVTMIFFVFVVIDTFIKNMLGGQSHAGFKLLFSVVIFMFIVLQGYFTFFAALGTFYIGAVLIGAALFFIFRHFGSGPGRGGEEAGGGRGQGMLPSIGGYVGKRIGGKLSGVERNTEMEVNQYLNLIDGNVAAMENAKRNKDFNAVGELYRSIIELKTGATREIENLENLKRVGGFDARLVDRKIHDYREKLRSLTEKAARIQRGT
ncbi:MAG: hypothetical protein HYX24_03395 [Candidatus Aenigmarchaeota archaeon]|nr:hypothetical protein [Candidatus Aenigmarchaeota archaeon]